MKKINLITAPIVLAAALTLFGGAVYALNGFDFSENANDWTSKTCTEQLAKQPSTGAAGEKATVCHTYQQTNKNTTALTQLSNDVDQLSTRVANYQAAPPADFAFFTNYAIKYGGYKTSPIYDANAYTKFSMTFTCTSSTNDKIKYWIETSADKVNWSPQGYYEVHCNGIYGGASTNVGSTAARYYQIAVQPITPNNNTNTINSFARFSN